MTLVAQYFVLFFAFSELMRRKTDLWLDAVFSERRGDAL